MSSYAQLVTVADNFLRNPVFLGFGSSVPQRVPPTVSLSLPPIHATLRGDLKVLGCSEATTVALEGVFGRALARLETISERSFATAVEDLSAVSEGPEDTSTHACLVSLNIAIGTKFKREAQTICEGILEEFQSAKARNLPTPLSTSAAHAVTYPLPEPMIQPNGAFTEEVIEILRRAFEKCETLTRGEVKGLQSITKLNSKQVRTWFANQRQRRGRKPAPYLPPRRAPAAHTPTKPFRNVSNSSTSSSLISYSSSSSDKPHFELQGSPAPISSLDFDHSPPEESRMDVEDVPMPQLNSTSPTIDYPRSLSIPAETGPFPVSSIPPAPTTAETDRFFSSQQFSSPLPPRSSEIYDVEYLPAQMPSTMSSDFLDQLQRTDPFLDDEFLKNVFGTLGVTQGGGLTLTMDSFQDEGEMSSGSGGSEGRGGSGEGQGSLMMEFARGGAGVGGPAGGFAFGW